MDKDELYLSRRFFSDLEYFEANVPGIIELKASFADEADEYLWLRKGEDVGADTIAAFVGLVNIMADPALVDVLKDFIVYTTASEKIYKYSKGIVERLEARKKHFEKEPFDGRKPKNLRILCWPNDDTEAARPVYEAQGYEVRHYAKEILRGSHRFYLNEKKFCLFLRTPEERFFGFIGSDESVRHQLKSLFEEEWKNANFPKRMV